MPNPTVGPVNPPRTAEPARQAAHAGRRRRYSLATRISLLAMLAATVAVVVAGLVSGVLLRSSAQAQGQKELRNDVALVAHAVDNTVDKSGRVRVPTEVVKTLADRHITIVVVDADGQLTGPEGRPLASQPLPAKDVARLIAGSPVSATRTLNRSRVYLEGQPLQGGRGVVLVEKVSSARSSEGFTRLRLAAALAIGLVVAAAAGLLLARRIVRPLQRAAAAAHRLSTGARDVRLEPEGPAEVAEVADALNLLASALTTSESRQREFLLSISHELRTPLTAVKGYAEALADGVVAPEAVAATGQVVLAESDRLERLVRDLLDLARLGADDFRIDVTSVDLAELLRQAGVVWADRCARVGVPFRVEIADGVGSVVHSDPARLRQIVDGLAENALRVTPSGRPIVFALLEAGSDVLMQVRDGGPGLTDDDCRVAFDRSVLYERYRGVRRVSTGVGLALVAGLAARLGGRAEAGHAHEGGACFTIRLPRG
ncbi:MAG: histidine kinase dimerization/phospho-acceptor domain-containing protein [Acidothermaceae bacterium]